MTTTFETAKVGDKVWDVHLGWGEVYLVGVDEYFPVVVVFPNEGTKTYTLDGLYTQSDANQTLFWDEIVIKAPAKPMPALQVDEKQTSELRDHIAIAYMQSCVAGNAYFETFEGVSEEAYKMADAMLKERDK